MTVLPEPSEPRPLVGTAVLAGALVGYGAFAVLISLVAGFANGAHANQALSAATWRQLGTGGGIVTAVVLFLAWAAGGFIAARLAGHDGLRHGVWTFVVGVVLMTIVAAAITWLPDTETILRNLRLLGIPVRRAEWRDVLSVAGIGSLAGMALGAAIGGRFGERSAAIAGVPAVTATVAPRAEPVRAEPAPILVEDDEPEPLFVADASTDAGTGEPVPEPVGDAFVPASERESGSAWWSPEPTTEPAPAAYAEPEPASAPAAYPEPESQPEPEPAEQHAVEREPVEAVPAPSSWWPDPGAAPAAAPVSEPEPAPAYDDAWALPDDAPVPAADDTEVAFPPPAPVEAHAAVDVEAAVNVDSTADVESEPEPAPLAEHADWPHDRGAFQTPPEPGDDEFLQHEPATLFEVEESREDEIRRRQQEDAARAYRRIIEEQ